MLPSLAAFIRANSGPTRALRSLAAERAYHDAERLYDKADQYAQAGNLARVRYLRAWGDLAVIS